MVPVEHGNAGRTVVTGVYERALGSAADDLHPKVRKRYALGSADDLVCTGRGRMDISRGTHVLPLLYALSTRNLLVPKAGHDVPFTVRTAGFEASGHEVLATIREFAVGRTRRRFDSLTVWDPEEKRLLDFLGSGGNIVSELHPTVEAGALVVKAGRQWLRLDDRYVRLPAPLAVDVEVRDRYDETDERYHVLAVVENTLAGHVLSYRGAFSQETETVGSVPADMRPTGHIDRLPPG